MRNASLCSSMVTAVLLAAAPARAAQVSEQLSVNGYGGWAYGITNGDRYLVGDGDGRYDNASFALLLNARPSESVVAAGQISYEGEAFELEWAFVEWRTSDLLRVRIGKVKQPLGLSMELADVGTVRPFYSLPWSIYGPSSIGSEAYLGAGATGMLRLRNGWGFQYDAYGGAIQVENYEPMDALRGITVRDLEPEVDVARNMLGARLGLLTPSGVRFMLSGHAGAMDDFSKLLGYAVYGASLEVQGDRLGARGEVFNEWEEDGDGEFGAYVETDFRITQRWQVAARAEAAKAKVENYTGNSPLLRHREAAIGLNYWASPDFVVRASFHLMRGKRYANPETFDGTLRDSTTHLVVLGSQFSF